MTEAKNLCRLAQFSLGDAGIERSAKLKSRRKKETPLTFEVAELFPRQGDWAEEDYFLLPETNRLVEFPEGSLLMLPITTTHTSEQWANCFTP
ncbi:MAG: hypothetical protein NZ805_10580 [Armatimonadetes bacterium]|nr:hypothetical protein [Armatimonadota bacterium]MDW8026886.1 hypothetical protein [Armatimonadota bacterium]